MGWAMRILVTELMTAAMSTTARVVTSRMPNRSRHTPLMLDAEADTSTSPWR